MACRKSGRSKYKPSYVFPLGDYGAWIFPSQNPTLSYGVTILGFLLCLLSMVFIVLGQKSVGEPGSPQVIRFKELEVKTNSVLMLVYRVGHSGCPTIGTAALPASDAL